jgi:hypothetical protein
VAAGWKLELEKIWLELEVDHFLKEIGVDFEESFLLPLRASNLESNPYYAHTWTFFRLDRLPPGVLHAAPIGKVGSSPALWEEWFIEGAENHHHSMHNEDSSKIVVPQSSELLHWRSPVNDIEHPETVMDVDWHYFNDADQRPYLLR